MKPPKVVEDGIGTHNEHARIPQVAGCNVLLCDTAWGLLNKLGDQLRPGCHYLIGCLNVPKCRRGRSWLYTDRGDVAATCRKDRVKDNAAKGVLVPNRVIRGERANYGIGSILLCDEGGRQANRRH